MATGRHILIAAYAIVKGPDVVYQDLGSNYFDQRDQQAVIRRETRRLAALGYNVTLEPLAPALQGLMGAHQRFLLEQLLGHIDELTTRIASLDAEIVRRVDPQAAKISLLCTIPGISRRTAEGIVAELGTDMTRFPDADHAAAWAGLAPGQNESAGKRQRAGTRRGNRSLRQALILAAWAASHTKNTFLGALYRRWVCRMPMKKAIVALAHRLLVIVVHVLTDGQPYQDLGPTYHDARDRNQIVHRAVHRLEKLGFRGTVEPADSVPATG